MQPATLHAALAALVPASTAVDLVAVRAVGYDLALGAGDGTFAGFVAGPVVPDPGQHGRRGVLVGDLDRAAPGDSDVHDLRSDGTGTLARQTPFQLSGVDTTDLFRLSAGDVNGDGSADPLAAGANGVSVGIHIPGSPPASTIALPGVGNLPAEGPVAVDLDEDGDSDLLVLEVDTDILVAWENDLAGQTAGVLPLQRHALGRDVRPSTGTNPSVTAGSGPWGGPPQPDFVFRLDGSPLETSTPVIGLGGTYPTFSVPPFFVGPSVTLQGATISAAAGGLATTGAHVVCFP